MSVGTRKRVCQVSSSGRYLSFFTSPKGNSATTETIAESVFTRITGSPGRITRGRSSARGAARNDVYGVTNLYWRDKPVIFSVETAASPPPSIFSHIGATPARAHRLGS